MGILSKNFLPGRIRSVDIHFSTVPNQQGCEDVFDDSHVLDGGELDGKSFNESFRECDIIYVLCRWCICVKKDDILTLGL